MGVLSCGIQIWDRICLFKTVENCGLIYLFQSSVLDLPVNSFTSNSDFMMQKTPYNKFKKIQFLVWV